MLIWITARGEMEKGRGTGTLTPSVTALELEALLHNVLYRHTAARQTVILASSLKRVRGRVWLLTMLVRKQARAWRTMAGYEYGGIYYVQGCRGLGLEQRVDQGALLSTLHKAAFVRNQLSALSLHQDSEDIPWN